MECHDINAYAAEGLAIGILLALMGIGGLVYAASVARRTAVGDLLLDACDGDEQAAAVAINNVKQETELVRDVTSYRARVASFQDEDCH